MLSKLYAVLCMGSMLVSGFSFADNDDFFSNSVVASIATGDNKDHFDLSSVIYIFDEEDIKESNKTHLYDLLDTLPGVEVVYSGASRLSPSLSIRGTRTTINPQILFLENGFEIQNVYAGGAHPYYNPLLNNVSRIEVSIGPSAVAYGNNAYSGVINIIKTNNEDEIAISRGSFNTQSLFFSKIFNLGDNGAFNLSYEALESDGDDSRIIQSDIQSQLDAFIGTNLSLAPGPVDTDFDSKSVFVGYQLDDFELQYAYRNYVYGTGVGISQALSPDSREKFTRHGFSLSNSIPLDHESDIIWRFKYIREVRDGQFVLLPEDAVVPLNEQGHAVSNTAAVTHFAIFQNGYRGNPVNKFNTYTLDLSWLNESHTDFNYTINTGLSHKTMETSETKNFGPSISDLNAFTEAGGLLIIGEDDFISVDNTPCLYTKPYVERNNLYASTVLEYKQDDFVSTVGLRADYYSDIDEFLISPRLSFLFPLSEEHNLKIGLSEAYRAPSFSELHSKNNPQFKGNIDLKPEEIYTVDFSYIWTFSKKGEVRANLYFNKERNLVAGVANDNGFIIEAENLPAIYTFGQEIFTQYAVDETFKLNASLSHFERRDTDVENFFLPAHSKMLKAGLSKQTDKFNFGLDLSWSNEIRGANADCECDTSYTLVNAFLSYAINPKTELKLDIRNLTNHQYSTMIEAPISYVPAEERNISVGLSYTF